MMHSMADNKIKIITTAKLIVSDDGVKSIIIKKILKLLNTQLSYYLHKLEANCTCVFDEYLNEEISNEKGHPCSYFNFSNGERKRIDIAAHC